MVIGSVISWVIFSILVGVRASGKQNVESGEIDARPLRLIELVDYGPKFDSDYLNDLISKAKKSWKGVKPDEWLMSIA